MKQLAKQYCLITAAVGLAVPLLPSCGTSVDVGENAEKGKPRPVVYGDEDAVGVGDDVILQPGSESVIPGTGTPIGSDGTGGVSNGGTTTDGGTTGSGTTTGGGSTGTTGNGTNIPLTCYGPNPFLPADFSTFCSDIPADLKTEFASAYDLVCKDQKLVNLSLFDVCNWTGDPATILKHRKILGMTDRSNTALTEFYMLTAYGVKSESSPDEHVSLIRREMNDPNFASSFVQIKNSSISNVTTLSDNHFQYSVTLANSAATVSFRANLIFWRVSDTMSVVFDYAFTDKVIIKDHKYIRFFVKAGDHASRVIGLDEKLLDDGGNHDVAYTNLMDVLKQRMTKDYENSTRD